MMCRDLSSTYLQRFEVFRSCDDRERLIVHRINVREVEFSDFIESLCCEELREGVILRVYARVGEINGSE